MLDRKILIKLFKTKGCLMFFVLSTFSIILSQSDIITKYEQNSNNVREKEISWLLSQRHLIKNRIIININLIRSIKTDRKRISGRATITFYGPNAKRRSALRKEVRRDRRLYKKLKSRLIQLSRDSKIYMPKIGHNPRSYPYSPFEGAYPYRSKFGHFESGRFRVNRIVNNTIVYVDYFYGRSKFVMIRISNLNTTRLKEGSVYNVRDKKFAFIYKVNKRSALAKRKNEFRSSKAMDLINTEYTVNEMKRYFDVRPDRP